MARPTSITDEQILKAARAVFLERGARATTADVARRAGIAEGSVFHRFKTKDELFIAAMRAEVEEPEWLCHLIAKVGRGDLRTNLEEAAMEAIEFFRRVIPLQIMSWSRDPKSVVPRHLIGRGGDTPPLRAIRRLASVFDAEMRAGRLRRHDPEIMARVFGGSLHHYAFFEILAQANAVLPLPAEMYVRGLVHLIWSGAGPARAGKKKERA
jgi:AcrR family transcriptional regulator